MHVKLTASLIAALLLCSFVTATGCVLRTPDEDTAYRVPDTYEGAMAEAAQRIQRLDVLIDRRQFDEAKKQAWILEDLTDALHAKVPTSALKPGAANEWAAKDYHGLVNDLSYTATWLNHYARQHAQADALDQVVNYIERYNRLALTFGPAQSEDELVAVPERSARDFGLSEKYADAKPGERLLYKER